MPVDQRAPSEWWPQPERKAPAPEQDGFQRTPSEGTRRLSASVEINHGLWSHAGFSQTGGPLHALQEQSFESLSSLSERELAERPGAALEEDQNHELSGMTWRGMSMDSAELRPVSSDMHPVQNDAVKRLAATEMKVEKLLREMAALKATGERIHETKAAAVATDVQGAAVQVGQAVVVQGYAVTAPLEATAVLGTGVGPQHGTQTSKVWLTPSGAAISLSTTGMPLLQAGTATLEEGTQFPEPPPPTPPDPAVVAAEAEKERKAKADKEREEKSKKSRRRALTTTGWLSFADDDPEERFDYCGTYVLCMYVCTYVCMHACM